MSAAPPPTTPATPASRPDDGPVARVVRPDRGSCDVLLPAPDASVDASPVRAAWSPALARAAAADPTAVP
ncbi:hypothetical protein, partial [Actinotalea sp. JY-7885]